MKSEILNKNENVSKFSSGAIEIDDDGTASENGDNIFCCKSKTGPDPKKSKKTKFTINQKVSLLMLAAADFMSFCAMSIMAPFYPAESAKKGMSESMSGVVFGFYALIVFLSCPVFGKVLPKFGTKFIFIAGLLLGGVSSIIFGFLDRVENYTPFLILSLVIRGFEALGASAYATAGYVLIINIFPDNAGAVRGFLETFVGLGLSAGPAIGGFMFSIGGFGLPFYTVGVVTLLIAVLNIFLLVKPEKNDVEKSGSLLNILKLFPVLITCMIMIVTSMSSSYLDPTLEPHLRKFNISPSQVGLLFLLLSATYGLTCPIWGWLSGRMADYTWIMTTGLFCSSIVLLFLGPSPFFTFLEDSIWLNVVALLFLGIFIAMSLMPTYQYVMDTAMENGFDESLGTHSVIAGLWSSVYSLGEVIGPILGGTIMEHFDFPTTSTMFAFLNFLTGIVALIYFKTKSLKCANKTGVPVDKKGVDNFVFSNEESSDKSLNDIISIRL